MITGLGANDVDIAAEFLPVKDLTHGDSFQAFQCSFEVGSRRQAHC
jgi:hypothetical protein